MKGEYRDLPRPPFYEGGSNDEWRGGKKSPLTPLFQRRGKKPPLPPFKRGKQTPSPPFPRGVSGPPIPMGRGSKRPEIKTQAKACGYRPIVAEVPSPGTVPGRGPLEYPPLGKGGYQDAATDTKLLKGRLLEYPPLEKGGEGGFAGEGSRLHSRSRTHSRQDRKKQLPPSPWGEGGGRLR